MGLGDALMKAMVPYDSYVGRCLAQAMMIIMQEESREESIRIAKEKGVFPLYADSIHGQSADAPPMRNAALLTVAPTGTTSLLFNVSGGVEPYFSLCYNYDKNAVLDGKTDLSMGMNPIFFNEFQSRFPELATPSVISEIRKNGSVLRGKFWEEGEGSQIPYAFRKIYATSMDISVEDHVEMQACVQRFVDNSMSKTINMPESASVNDVIDTYAIAWEQNCKGCTVYRDNSRKLQVLRTGDGEDSGGESSESLKSDDIPDLDSDEKSCVLDASANGGALCMSCS